jgi:hypothetical protein
MKPENCRDRLKEEGKAYPKSGCAVCAVGGLLGCPFDRPYEQDIKAILAQNNEVLEGVLAQMDNINEKHGTFYGGFAFFEAARQIARNREFLARGN